MNGGKEESIEREEGWVGEGRKKEIRKAMDRSWYKIQKRDV